jgi:hypothetical protein
LQIGGHKIALVQSAETINHNKMEDVVEGTTKNKQSSADRQPPHEWVRLIRKLRWIGLDDEARRLELAVRTLPPEERGTVSVGPFSTD